MAVKPNSLRTLSGIPNLERLDKKKTALLLIDFQMESFTGALPVPNAELIVEKAVKLMDWADKHKIKTIHMQRLAKSPASPVYAPESPGAELHPLLHPRKKHDLFPKYATSLFSGTIVHGRLQAENIDTLILTGLTTPLAISASAHDAWSLGYRCLVLADVTGSRDLLSWDKTKIIPASTMQEAHLAGLADKFAQVLTAEELMALPLK